MTVEKPKRKQLLRPITTGADSVTNPSEFLAITCESLKARDIFQTKSNSLFAKYLPIVNIS